MQAEYVVRTLAVERAGWDTLAVAAQFAGLSPWSQERPATPDAVAVYLFDAAYDTLYAGAGPVVAIPDGRLGDRERLLLEVCGTFDAQTVCEQQAVSASPKRLRLEHTISFPEDAAFERGSYDLRFAVERQAFDSSRWERIDRPGSIEGYLLAYVGDADTEAVQVPFSARRGRFDLKRYAHFDDFRYHLKARLIDVQEAAVRFDVYAGLRGQPAYRLASVEKRVRAKTEEERLLEVRHFARQAIGQILERLGFAEHEQRARVYLDHWEFNRLTGVYLVELEMAWRQGGFFGRRYELTGLLEVKEDGAEARFVRRRANERAGQRWRDAAPGNLLMLDTLTPYVAPEEKAAAEGRIAGRE